MTRLVSMETQPNILNRVSTLFGRKKGVAEEKEMEEMIPDDSSSRVDSLYSSIHSRQSVPPSNHPPPPPPVRTVKLENPTVHHSKTADVEEAFKQLLQEYAPSADHMSHVNNLSYAQKQLLIRCSRSPNANKKSPSFSLKATLGFKPRLNLGESIFQAPTEIPTQSLPLKSHQTSESFGRTARSKLKSTPEYFVQLLNETQVRDLKDSDVLDLRVFLRSEVASWTTVFLTMGGYDAIANLLRQMKESPKRYPNDDRMIQHLGKCLKTIMTHQSMGTEIVLTNPVALSHVRDLLFGPPKKKLRLIYGLEINTRRLLLDLMCTLAILQTAQSPDTEYIHGYDVLRRLLLNTAQDTQADEEDNKPSPPFRMSLKTDPREILQMIMKNDPNGQIIGYQGSPPQHELKPRYTAWMKELLHTTEKHIETITFLAQVLDYDFNSAYRQIKARETTEHTEIEAAPLVMTEEGVVEYIITHLRLMRTIVTTQPTSYTGLYDEQEQEKMRLELMLSGFDKISKMLLHCPHPTVRNSYISYLKPLMNPCAEIVENQLPPLPPRTNFSSECNALLVMNDSSVSVYADDEPECVILEAPVPNEEEPYDDIFQEDGFLEDHFNSDCSEASYSEESHAEKQT